MERRAALSNETIAQLREEYGRSPLHRDDMEDDAILVFQRWLAEAVACDVHEPTAMTLATSTTDGRPSARMVLLKGVDQAGFRFYTNYESRKGRELMANPWAALVFWWPELTRQVRVEGRAARMSAEESDAYYQSRPRGARLGAWVSNQSRVIQDRAVLEAGLAAVEEQYHDIDPPRPPHWGGFRLAPVRLEFWQGSSHRLHDRFQYLRQEDGSWQVARLAP